MSQLNLRRALLSIIVALGAGGASAQEWNHATYTSAMKESGRANELSERDFKLLQERRAKAIPRIESYLKERFGAADPLVMKAFREVPREYFHYHYAEKRSTARDAYEDNAKPWAIGFGSALSDYLGQAYMTQIAKPTPESVTLEIGTGSGYQSAILSRIVKASYSVEIIEPLGKAVGRIFGPLGYKNIESKVGDGYFGWPEVKDGFDIIIVTCAAQYVPPELFKQLKTGGRLVIPIGQPFKKGQFLYIYTKDADGKIHSRKDVGVFFIPMTGEMMKKPGKT